jgi:hypothetical protein
MKYETYLTTIFAAEAKTNGSADVALCAAQEGAVNRLAAEAKNVFFLYF